MALEMVYIDGTRSSQYQHPVPFRFPSSEGLFTTGTGIYELRKGLFLVLLSHYYRAEEPESGNKGLPRITCSTIESNVHHDQSTLFASFVLLRKSIGECVQLVALGTGD